MAQVRAASGGDRERKLTQRCVGRRAPACGVTITWRRDVAEMTMAAQSVQLCRQFEPAEEGISVQLMSVTLILI